jgi:AcrR family transcriptional regulator
MSSVKMEPPVKPTRQTRSALTVQRLIEAATTVLARDGYDAATIPKIAKMAGVGVGTVYVRFADKDALLRTVYMDFFMKARPYNNQLLAELDSSISSLPDLIRAIVKNLVESYRTRRRLLRALLLYAETHDDPKFKKRALKVNKDVFSAVASMLLDRKRQIRSRDPEAAIRFGLLTIAALLRTATLDEGGTLPISLDDPHLAERMSTMLIAYLAV